MSLLPLKSHVTVVQPTYLPYFSAGNMNASTISTGTINASSIVANHISCISLDAEYMNTSTINALHIDLDGQILTADANDLLLNGVPIATTASLSSIQDWSLFPAISTVQMGGNDLNVGGTLSSVNIRSGNGFFTNLIAYNSLFVSTATSTISSMVVTGDEGIFSTLNSGNLVISGAANMSTLNISSINGAEFTPSSITVNNIGTSSIITQSISTLGAEIRQGLISSIVFSPSLGGVSLGGVNLGLGSILGNVIGWGAGVFGAAAGTVGMITGTAALMMGRSGSNVNVNNFEMVNGTTQIQFSTLGASTTSVYRFVDNSGADPSQVPGAEIFISTILPAGTHAIRSFSDPINTLSSPNSTIQAFGQWIEVPFSMPSSISSIQNWAEFPAVSTIDANGFNLINVNGGICSTIDLPGSYSTVEGLLRLGMVDGLNGGHIQFNTLQDGSTFQTLYEAHPPAGGGSFLLTVANETNTYSDMSMRGIYFGSGSIASAPNGHIVAGPAGLELTLISSINGNAYTPNAITASSISTAYLLGANANLFGLGLQGLEIDAANLFLSTPSVVHPGNFNGSTCSFTQGNIRSVIASTITTSSISLNSGVYSTILVPQATPNPGVGTSSVLFVNTDLNLGNNDLYAQQIRLGRGQVDNFAEILMYGNDGSTKNLLTGSADRTFRIASSSAPVGPGYVLDTALNAPFFSTINQSTSMMAYFPSSIANTIGVSTISFIPPKVVAGAFISQSTQTVLAADTPLAISYDTATFATGGINFSTTAIVIPAPGIYELSVSIQLDKIGGGTSPCDFWFQKNGTSITNSASRTTVQGNTGEVLATVSIFEPCVANDKIEVLIASSDATMAATFFQSTITPYVRPAIPSIIVNAKCLNY
jgi:hypothetical protein